MINVSNPGRLRQRHGVMVRSSPFGSGPQLKGTVYTLRDEEEGLEYECDYSDIVTEGFRTIVLNEQVRFFVDPDEPGRARFIVRLQDVDIEAIYR